MTTTALPVGTDPVPLLQDLIRIDTTNPPGDEGRCVTYLAGLLDDVGVEYRVLSHTPGRANLVARFAGRGRAPGLLLHAHSDVVPVVGQRWQYPPFEGRCVDGHVWGRGAVDMKGGLAMMLAALLRMRRAGERPAGDVMLAVVADEENGSAAGAGYLVREHPEIFAGVRYAIGEEAGATIELGERRFHPVVVGEKRAGWLRATLRGPGGHGSRMAPPGTAMAQLGRLLGAVAEVRLPRHVVPAVDRMLAELAGHLPEPLAAAVSAIRADGRDARPAGLPDDEARYLDSVLRHTINPTVVRTSDKINVVPSEITVDLDGRILPGPFTVDDFVGELRAVVGADVPLELLLEGEAVPMDRIAEPELGGFYTHLCDVLRELDPEGIPLPMVTAASTDARLFAQLGIRCYGWLPLRVPAGSPYRRLLHTPDERVPTDALEFGTQCLVELMRRFG